MTPEYVAVPVGAPPPVISTTSILNDESPDVHEISARMEPYFWDPVAVHLDENERIYVLETGMHRFQIFESLNS